MTEPSEPELETELERGVQVGVEAGDGVKVGEEGGLEVGVGWAGGGLEVTSIWGFRPKNGGGVIKVSAAGPTRKQLKNQIKTLSDTKGGGLITLRGG